MYVNYKIIGIGKIQKIIKMLEFELCGVEALSKRIGQSLISFNSKSYTKGFLPEYYGQATYTTSTIKKNGLLMFEHKRMKKINTEY